MQKRHVSEARRGYTAREALALLIGFCKLTIELRVMPWLLGEDNAEPGRRLASCAIFLL